MRAILFTELASTFSWLAAPIGLAQSLEISSFYDGRPWWTILELFCLAQRKSTFQKHDLRFVVSHPSPESAKDGAPKFVSGSRVGHPAKPHGRRLYLPFAGTRRTAR